jgi:hypothetical protein
MGKWQQQELDLIAASDDLQIAPLRSDGKTYGTLTWIWSVVVDGELYVRAYNETNSRWHKGAIAQKEGCITAAGLIKEVVFEPVKGALNQRIDEAYRAKYAASPYLKPMIGARAHDATIKITPTN